MKTHDSSGKGNVICTFEVQAERIVPGEFWCAYGMAPVSFATPTATACHLAPSRSRVSHASPQRRKQNVGKTHRHSLLFKGQNTRSEAPYLNNCTLQDITRLLLVFIAIFFVLHAGVFSLSTSAVGASIPTELISVSPGDTLWSIAAGHPIEGMTTQQCVRWISSTNDLDGSVLVPGQAIEVPSSASL